MVFGAGLAAILVGAAGMAWWRSRPRGLDPVAFAARYDAALLAPQTGLAVYHLGHSLVGRDIPVMLEQLAVAAGFAGHTHASQLGWGASLDQHRRGDVPGFAEENAHPNHAPVEDALASGQFHAVVVTELVEIRDAIKYHDSAEALAHWARTARAANPQARVYLYETWHRLDDAEGWLERVDADFTRAWQDELMRVAMADPAVGTIYIIPGGQVLAVVVRAMEAGEVPGLSRREQLFSTDAAGAVDPIHLNDLGAYIIALAHFATLYQRSPEGLPWALLRAGGMAATPVPDAAVPPLQKLVWQGVTRYAFTGVAR
jgi:hypothetical protein